MMIRNILLLSGFALITCSKIDCEAAAELNRKTECLLIFEELPVFDSPFLNAKGKHLITGDECECKDTGRWWSIYRKHLKKGDTIIKRRGELTFNIHKKDTVSSFDWECQGKVYK